MHIFRLSYPHTGVKSLGGVYNTQTKLNPGAALEEPEHQGIRSINAREDTAMLQTVNQQWPLVLRDGL